MTQADLWKEERRLWAMGYRIVCGVDEAGAGPLAGPVYAAAVILPPELEIVGLNDSKQVTAKMRNALFYEIQAKAVAYAVTFVDVGEIDKYDILNARIKAMDDAINALMPEPDMALVDGNRDHGSRVSITAPHLLLVGGDGRSANVAAASILAKVSRDRYMEALAKRDPRYKFDRNKGYGTKAHYEALDKYGASPFHRKSFLKKWRARRGES